MTTMTANASLGDGLRHARAKWGWFAALGIALILAGLFATSNLFLSSLASVFYIAAMMLVGAVLQLGEAISEKGWKRRTLSLASGLFYAIASIVLLYDPILAAIDLALAFGILLIAAGVMKIVAGLRKRDHAGWGWIVASGVITTALGVLIIATWPAAGLWLLGTLLAVDLLFQGWSFLAFGLAMRRSLS